MPTEIRDDMVTCACNPRVHTGVIFRHVFDYVTRVGHFSAVSCLDVFVIGFVTDIALQTLSLTLSKHGVCPLLTGIQFRLPSSGSVDRPSQQLPGKATPPLSFTTLPHYHITVLRLTREKSALSLKSFRTLCFLGTDGSSKSFVIFLFFFLSFFFFCIAHFYHRTIPEITRPHGSLMQEQKRSACTFNISFFTFYLKQLQLRPLLSPHTAKRGKHLLQYVTFPQSS